MFPTGGLSLHWAEFSCLANRDKIFFALLLVTYNLQNYKIAPNNPESEGCTLDSAEFYKYR